MNTHPEWIHSLELEKEISQEIVPDFSALKAIYSLPAETLFGDLTGSVKSSPQDALAIVNRTSDDEEAISYMYCMVLTGCTNKDLHIALSSRAKDSRPFLSALVAKMGADRGIVDCMSLYAAFLQEGRFFEKDPQKTFRLCNRGLKAPNPEMRSLAEILMAKLLSGDSEKADKMPKAEAPAAIETASTAPGAPAPVGPSTPASQSAPTPVSQSAPAPVSQSASAPDIKKPSYPRSPFIEVDLYGVASEGDYWAGTESVNTINKNRTPYAMFNIIFKRPIFKAGEYNLKYAFRDDGGNTLSEGTTAIFLNVGNDRIAQGFNVANDADGLYHISFSLEGIAGEPHDFTYRIVSDDSVSAAEKPVLYPDSSDEVIAGVALKGSTDPQNYWNGDSLMNSISFSKYSYAMFNLFLAQPYIRDEIIEIRMMILDCFGNIVKDDISSIEVHNGYDRLAKSLPLIWDNTKHYAAGEYFAVFTIGDRCANAFKFTVEA